MPVFKPIIWITSIKSRYWLTKSKSPGSVSSTLLPDAPFSSQQRLISVICCVTDLVAETPLQRIHETIKKELHSWDCTCHMHTHTHQYCVAWLIEYIYWKLIFSWGLSVFAVLVFGDTYSFTVSGRGSCDELVTVYAGQDSNHLDVEYILCSQLPISKRWPHKLCLKAVFSTVLDPLTWKPRRQQPQQKRRPQLPPLQQPRQQPQHYSRWPLTSGWQKPRLWGHCCCLRGKNSNVCYCQIQRLGVVPKCTWKQNIKKEIKNCDGHSSILPITLIEPTPPLFCLDRCSLWHTEHMPLVLGLP